MKRATKGVLLSGLVFPGLGQFVLGRRRRGALIVLVVLVLMLVIVIQGTRLALGILAGVETGGGPVDVGAITAAATAAVRGGEALIIERLLVLIIGCWIGAVIDAYVIGRQLDRDPGAQ